MDEVPICIFSHFVIDSRMFLEISDRGYDIETD